MANDSHSQTTVRLTDIVRLLPPLPSKQANSPVVSAKHIDGILISHDCVLAAPRKKEMKDGGTGSLLADTHGTAT